MKQPFLSTTTASSGSNSNFTCTSSTSSAAPALFKATDKYSHQERYFGTSQEAYEWMLTHRDWTLAKRDTVRWTFPLDRILAKECWVKVEAAYHSDSPR